MYICIVVLFEIIKKNVSCCTCTCMYMYITILIISSIEQIIIKATDKQMNDCGLHGSSGLLDFFHFNMCQI